MRNFKFDIVDRALDLVQVDFDVNRMGTSLTRLRLESEQLLRSLMWLCVPSLGHRPQVTATSSGLSRVTATASPTGRTSQQQGYPGPQWATRSAASVGLAAIG